MKIAFVHPDLGIGGAERLVVDAAVGLQDLNNDVAIFTSHCDRSHCFEEVSSNLVNVTVFGDFLPTSFHGKFHILFAILRQLYLVLALIVSGTVKNYDYFIIDQLSFCIPLIYVFKTPQAKILFYCHFPDQLLSSPQGFLKRLYRIPFDWLEEYTTGLSDKLVVNSLFTKSVFHKTFPSIHADPDVIYPCVDIDQAIIETANDKLADNEVHAFFQNRQFLLSINRFERKKNIELAINAYAKYKVYLETNGLKVPLLVVAGGFDARVAENVQYLHELELLADSLALRHFTIRSKLLVLPPSTNILFLPSIKTSIKKSLIKNTKILLYTPSNEHFGIVPVESMLFKTPVLAPDNGGPLESVVNYYDDKENATGFNVSADVDQWYKTLIDFQGLSDQQVTKLGDNGFKTVLKKFLRPQMSQQFLNSLNTVDSHEKAVLLVVINQIKWLALAMAVALAFYRFI